MNGSEICTSLSLATGLQRHRFGQDSKRPLHFAIGRYVTVIVCRRNKRAMDAMPRYIGPPVLQQSRAHDVRAFDGARPFENVRASSISSAVAKSPFCGGSQEMPWWSIRAVYVHDHNDQQHFYEERIMLFRAETFEDAFDLADQESERYLQVNPTFRRVGRWTGFAVHDDADLSGAEIWSSLSRSELSPVEYYETRYERFEEEPDTEDGSG